MTTMTATEARKLPYRLLDDVADWRAAKNLRPLA